MLSAFFMGHLFNKINDGGLEREEITVPVLKELLANCSARALMSNPEDLKLSFKHWSFSRKRSRTCSWKNRDPTRPGLTMNL